MFKKMFGSSNKNNLGSFTGFAYFLNFEHSNLNN